MKKSTVCANWEINYKCDTCGATVFNATAKKTRCDVCGGVFEEVAPINSRNLLKKKSWWRRVYEGQFC